MEQPLVSAQCQHLLNTVGLATQTSWEDIDAPMVELVTTSIDQSLEDIANTMREGILAEQEWIAGPAE